ncbi:RICIN domain-containing protein [Agrococcus sp. Marseille-P2731]|uniref:RICIN domain-containing protein n=1 Tax=Agrococcus sp. Marseille-P2731 TaxID=1841862 RepID=UPI00092FDB5F|nr:RICIN domain-containing protein [Agrococcus sp. Marseille-P2731]
MRRTRKGLMAFAVGALAFAMLAGGGAASAYWTAGAQGSGQVTTQAVRVSQTSFPSLGATFINTHTSLTTTGSFTVTNSGGVAGVASTTITSADARAAQLALRIWPVASTAACTAATAVPVTAGTGTWASTTVAGTSLAAGASQVLCVRTTLPVSQRNALASTTGTTSVAANLNVSLVGTGTGWTAASAPAPAAHTTQAIYPLDTSLAPVIGSRWHTLRTAASTGVCLDVSGAGGVGAAVIGWTCTQVNSAPQANQLWQVVPVSEADRTLVTLRPRHQPTMRLAVDATGRQTLAIAAAGAAQQWYVQRASASTVQLVSAVDGRCLSLPTASSATARTTVDCTDATAAVLSPQLQPLGFTWNPGLIGLGSNAALTVGANRADFILEREASAGVWQSVAFVQPAAYPTMITIAPANLFTGNTTLRLRYADGTVAYAFVLNRSTTNVVSAVSGTG